MSLTDNSGVEHSGLGVKRVDGRVDTQLGDGSRQHSGGVQVREGGGGGRVSQVIGRDVDGLYGGNGTLLGGGTRKKKVKACRKITENATYIRSCIPPMSVERVGW